MVLAGLLGLLAWPASLLTQDDCDQFSKAFVITPGPECKLVTLERGWASCACDVPLPPQVRLADVGSSGSADSKVADPVSTDCPFSECQSTGCYDSAVFGFSKVEASDLGAASSFAGAQTCSYLLEPGQKFTLPDVVDEFSFIVHQNREALGYECGGASGLQKSNSISDLCRRAIHRLQAGCGDTWPSMLPGGCEGTEPPYGFTESSTIKELCPVDCAKAGELDVTGLANNIAERKARKKQEEEEARRQAEKAMREEAQRVARVKAEAADQAKAVAVSQTTEALKAALKNIPHGTDVTTAVAKALASKPEAAQALAAAPGAVEALASAPGAASIVARKPELAEALAETPYFAEALAASPAMASAISNPCIAEELSKNPSLLKEVSAKLHGDPALTLSHIAEAHPEVASALTACAAAAPGMAVPVVAGSPAVAAARAAARQLGEEQFDRMDLNSDRKITIEEFVQAKAAAAEAQAIAASQAPAQPPGAAMSSVPSNVVAASPFAAPISIHPAVPVEAIPMEVTAASPFASPISLMPPTPMAATHGVTAASTRVATMSLQPSPGAAMPMAATAAAPAPAASYQERIEALRNKLLEAQRQMNQEAVAGAPVAAPDMAAMEKELNDLQSMAAGFSGVESSGLAAAPAAPLANPPLAPLAPADAMPSFPVMDKALAPGGLAAAPAAPLANPPLSPLAPADATPSFPVMDKALAPGALAGSPGAMPNAVAAPAAAIEYLAAAPVAVPAASPM
eukprot:TRINITY_DN9040_c0_g1_i2.p1 TRINITY_DN9040_c0_g1~~TRINITY_DN9040_c0_g1_i2.p1  ORF type:complete len:746 (+),score=200.17 TRINITY_DN9040_c0_g1_i2:76-2313(+)